MANRLANPLPLKVVPFTNPSGGVAYRVTGTHNGQRVRKNFPTETEALVFLNQRVKTRDTRPPAPVITSLTPDQVRQAEAATLRLPHGATLVQAVDFFAENHRPLSPLALEDPAEGTGAITAFTHWLDRQRKNELVTILQRESVLKHFAKTSGATRSDAITVARASSWIYDPEVEPRTQRDRFDLLNFFCDFLVKRRHAATNPVLELDRPVVKVDAPGVHTFDEVWRLLQCALTDAEGPHMLPFFAICVLSGVRPQEVPRLGRKLADSTKTDGWEDIHLDEEHRLIEVNKAKGGRSRRNAEICEPLWRILTWCKSRGLAANYFSVRKFNRIRRAAGLFDRWEKDLLRHTYASHHYVLHKDIKTLTANMGNSERVLFQNYIRPVSRSDAAALFGIVLHYSAPRALPVAVVRMEQRLSAPPATLTLSALRVLVARLASELWRMNGMRPRHPLADAVATYLSALRKELFSRKKEAAPAGENGRRSISG